MVDASTLPVATLRRRRRAAGIGALSAVHAWPLIKVRRTAVAGPLGGALACVAGDTTAIPVAMTSPAAATSATCLTIGRLRNALNDTLSDDDAHDCGRRHTNPIV